MGPPPPLLSPLPSPPPPPEPPPPELPPPLLLCWLLPDMVEFGGYLSALAAAFSYGAPTPAAATPSWPVATFALDAPAISPVEELSALTAKPGRFCPVVIACWRRSRPVCS